jgi:phage terminase small subunit
MKPETKTAEKPDKTPSPPAHLSKKMKKFWISIFQSKILKPHETLIFLKACEAHDRAEQARRVLKDKGLTFIDCFNSPRTRPEVAIERDSRVAFARLLATIYLYKSEWTEF